ncbi:hypothetical protein Tco_1410711 [Tanacetum coccineum]
MSSEEAEKESTKSNSGEEAHVTGSMVKSSKEKKLKNFDFVTEGGENVYLTKEQINAQKEIEEEAKAKAARREGEIRKEELIDLLGLEIVNKKGPITLKVYRKDGTSEFIPNFKASDLHLGEWRKDPLDKLNDLANKKRKHADDIHDYFKATKRLKSSVQYGDHLPSIMLNETVLGPEVDDHARTFSSLLLAEVDKRNLNPLKQMGTIEQLRQ